MIRELEQENSILRAKYAKALELLRRYKTQVEIGTLPLSAKLPAGTDPESISVGKEKITNVWREKLLRMNSLSPRKEPTRLKTSEPIFNRDVLDLAEALNSGDFRLDTDHGECMEEISELLSSKRNVY